jgi:hypothetical protein
MKKIFFGLFPLLILAVLLGSCKKDKDTAEKFSTLGVEENKATIENSGIEMVKVMDRMSSIQSIDVFMNLGDLLSSSDTKKMPLTKSSKIYSTLETFVGVTKGTAKIKDLILSMAAPKDLQDDPETLQEFWDANVGTYSWNPELNDWDIELGGTKFIISFPSTSDAVSNDATLTIHDYTGVTIANPIDDDYTGDLPVSLNADLKVGTTTLLSYTFAASYNSDGVPKSIASDLTIENYKFEVDIINSTNLVSFNYKFLEDSKVVLDWGASGEGLFTQDNYDANTQTHTDHYTYTDWVWNNDTQQYDPVEVTMTDEWKETDFEEILHAAHAHFQIFDIAIRGDINVKTIVDQTDLIDADLKNEVIDEETANNKKVDKINENMNLRLINVPSNQIIAKAEAYVVKDLEYNDSYIDLRLTFHDNSKVDMETYKNTGFDSFVSELNSLIEDLNSNYNLNLEPVEYK